MSEEWNLDEARRMYEAGATSDDVAVRFGVHHVTVLKRLRKAGVSIRGRGAAKHKIPWDDTVARKLYSEGWTVKAIAHHFGVGAERVCRCLRDDGVHIKKGRGRFLASDVETIKSMHADGHTVTAIARHFKSTRDTVAKVLKKEGVALQTGPKAVKTNAVEWNLHEAAQMHRSGLSLPKIAAHFGIKRPTLYQRFLRANIPIRERKSIPKTLIPDILARYESGDSTYEIGEMFGFTPASIRKILLKSGVAMRSARKQRTYTLNETVFDNAEQDPTAAYFCGFLMADGGVSDSGRITLALAIKDQDQVAAFQAFLGTNRPIRLITDTRNSNKAELVVSSRKLADALARYGITPRKSATAKVNLLEDSIHFWRGVIDGDGSLGIYGNRSSPVLALFGSFDLLTQFAAFTHSHIGFRPNIRPKVGCWQIHLGGRRAQAMARILYSDIRHNDRTIALTRKLQIANSIIALDLSNKPTKWSHLTASHLYELYAQFGTWKMVAGHFNMLQESLFYIRRRLGMVRPKESSCSRNES